MADVEGSNASLNGICLGLFSHEERERQQGRLQEVYGIFMIKREELRSRKWLGACSWYLSVRDDGGGCAQIEGFI